mmetsp:Transcript_26331/g.54583  ORF Transcript_26331/g.54583 Transcript_26331/m.54583 type:complete len:97 (+) Transcript_26331:1-291(+)
MVPCSLCASACKSVYTPHIRGGAMSLRQYNSGQANAETRRHAVRDSKRGDKRTGGILICGGKSHRPFRETFKLDLHKSTSGIFQPSGHNACKGRAA